MRLTLTDVAREAGVSTATVDRALNNRSKVKLRTREVVIETARRLGYISAVSGAPAPAVLPVGKPIRLDFALPVGTNAFVKALHGHIVAQALLRPDIDAHVATLEEFSPDALAQTLRDLAGKTQGIGVIALDHPTVREAIRSLAAHNVKVVTLASDILHVPRVAYVGIDNRAAGRLAGYLLSRFMGPQRRGKVALFAGSLSYRGHQEREMGFRHILAEEFPDFRIVELREMQDDLHMAYAEASALLDRHPDLMGLYNVGAGNSGLARALKERKLDRKVVFVGHEATEGTKELLLDGTIDAVIDQNPRVEAREALNILCHAVRGLPYDPHPPRLQVVFKENIPES
jgi:LacI family transcriptional regulator